MRGFKEHLTTSARAVSERFFDQSRYRKRSNTLCISRFRYRRVGGKDPLTVADDVVRCSLLPHFLVKPCPLTKPPLRTQRFKKLSIQFLKSPQHLVSKKPSESTCCYTFVIIFRQKPPPGTTRRRFRSARPSAASRSPPTWRSAPRPDNPPAPDGHRGS
mgnify:CR=1 FL=1